MSNHPRHVTCPFPHSTSLTRQDRDTRGESIQRDERGVYRVHGFGAAREVLRDENVHQAGFMSETAREFTPLKRQPVLFAEGAQHHEMRRDTARFFTPTHVATYTPMIARLADDLIGQLAEQGEANIDDLSLTLAVRVAARVVGLTSNRAPGLERRIMTFVHGDGDSEPGSTARPNRLRALQQQAQLSLFYFLDVKPAIEHRRKHRQEDLISHLLDRNYSDLEIMTECLTYGTAGMVTTREFITIAAWHLLRNTELRQQYVHSLEQERHAILHEILRLEPVVSVLYRRAQQDLTIAGRHVPQGSLIALHLQQANSDPEVAGPDAHSLCPARTLPRGVQAPVLSFGDGHHRCPGAFLAIKETDVFLRRLLMLGGLRMVKAPSVTFNQVVKGYELRGLRVALTRAGG